MNQEEKIKELEGRLNTVSALCGFTGSAVITLLDLAYKTMAEGDVKTFINESFDQAVENSKNSSIPLSANTINQVRDGLLANYAKAQRQQNNG